MKKKLSLLLAALLLIALAASVSSAVKAVQINPKVPKSPILPIITPTPNPFNNPQFKTKIPFNPGFATPRPRITPTPTPKTPGTPKAKTPGAGAFVTSEGPLFTMYRDGLTSGYEMFTPMDLSLDGEYAFPLVSNALHTVGELKVTVRNGLVTVRPQMFLGVSLEDGLLTFFPDIRSVKTIDPKDLEGADIPFGLPVSVASRFGTDARVLLYLNCPVSYQADAASVMPFSLQDPAYLERIYALAELMD